MHRCDIKDVIYFSSIIIALPTLLVDMSAGGLGMRLAHAGHVPVPGILPSISDSWQASTGGEFNILVIMGNKGSSYGQDLSCPSLNTESVGSRHNNAAVGLKCAFVNNKSLYW